MPVRMSVKMSFHERFASVKGQDGQPLKTLVSELNINVYFQP